MINLNKNILWKSLLVTITIVIILAIKMNQKSVKTEDLTFQIEATLSSLEAQNETNTLIQKKDIKDQFINLVYKTVEGGHISYFVNAQNGTIMDIKDIIIEGENDNFQKKINELLELKYPKFIADVLKSNKGTIAYEVQDSNLMLYFSNFQITPKINEELNLKVDYNEIKDYIKFSMNLNEEYENENGYHYRHDKKTVALTFDDGPNGAKTKRLVETLKDNKMHATFFMVGNRMRNDPDTVKYVLDSKNEIGSHSFHHKNLTRLKKEELMMEEADTQAIYKKITGETLHLLRPPYGNINSLMKENLNYVFVNWNIDPEDWRYRNVDHIFNEVISKVEDGDIILMHDLYDTTIEAVQKLLPELYARGFQVVSVTELANLKGMNLESKKVYRNIK